MVYSQTTLSTHFDSQLLYELALLNVDGIGPKTFSRSLSFFGSARQVFFSSSKALLESGLKSDSVEQIIEFSKHAFEQECTKPITMVGKRLKANLDWASLPNHFIISTHCAQYPQVLKHIYNAPPLLFVIGNPALLNQQQLAMVGARKASSMGKHFATQCAQQLAGKGFVITSGLAQGIDAAAHEGALAAREQSTIAVLAHGLDGLYPAKNKTLAANIVNQGGALISEFPVGIAPKPEYFPRRNRIISGMSLGVLVVEAEIKSGSLVTAYCALEQGREVFAVPGAPNNPLSKGCNQLIKQGAKLVEGVEDLLEDLPAFKNQSDLFEYVHEVPAQIEISLAELELSPLEKKVLEALKNESKSINTLVEELKDNASDIAAALTMLELKALVLTVEQGFQMHPQLLAVLKG